MQKLATLFTTLPIKWYLALITVVATGLRLISITKASIWHDEGYTMMLIQHGPMDIIARTARDFHPPLYYLISHWWTLLFGNSELAIRSLSLLCGVGVVVLVYFIVKRLRFAEVTARLAALLTAFGPFLVRYSEEARMYGMAALLVCAATLALLIALDERTKPKKQSQQLYWWVVYGILMAAALYTHYYVAFIVFVHIGYAWHSYGGFAKMVKAKEWWVGNLLAVGLFIPWIPAVIAQFTRVQGGYWIPPVTAETIPNTFMQFAVFSGDLLPSSIEMLLTVALACYVTVVLLRTTKAKRPQLWVVIAWMMTPLLIALLVSLKQPVYYDRYFAYSATAFYVLIAILITNVRSQTWIKASLVAALLLMFSAGIGSVAQQAGHQMSTIGNYVSSHYQTDDVIVSGELYTYFDFSYYNTTGQPVHLLSKDRLPGYGESSLIYDIQDEIVAPSLESLNDASRVWVVGKTGDHDYYTDL
ncbi:MAG: glycosyltransferase family 39 protein, partial [Candidatus Saccharimonadales bacterium]